MPDSLKFALAWLALGAVAVPPSLAIQRFENDSQAKVMAEAATGGHVDAGKAAVLRRGCGACHTIPGVPGAAGQVGPQLSFMTQRAELAGRPPNDPDRMIDWILHPQTVSPGSGMPEMNLSEQEARDIAAFLYIVRAS